MVVGLRKKGEFKGANNYIFMNKKNIVLYLINAEKKTLGRLCSQIASINSTHALNTKTTLSFYLIINCNKIEISKKKAEKTKIFYCTNKPGHLKFATLSFLLKKQSMKPFEKALTGMLPNNSQSSKLIKRIFYFPENIISLRKNLLKI